MNTANWSDRRVCSSLEIITIPDSVTTIGSYVFESCSSLETIIIGKNDTTIGSYAFSSCSSLKNITIPDSVTTIESCAFELPFCRSNSPYSISLHLNLTIKPFIISFHTFFFPYFHVINGSFKKARTKYCSYGYNSISFIWLLLKI